MLVGAAMSRAETLTGALEAEPEVLGSGAEARAQEQDEAFDRWRDSLPEDATGGALILPLCAPSELADEIETVLAAAEEAAPSIDEVVDFVGMALEEARGEQVLARLSEQSDGVEIVLRTRAGLELDRRSFGLGEGGLTVEAVREAVGRLVPIVEGEP